MKDISRDLFGEYLGKAIEKSIGSFVDYVSGG
jgi:hypothetical protein